MSARPGIAGPVQLAVGDFNLGRSVVREAARGWVPGGQVAVVGDGVDLAVVAGGQVSTPVAGLWSAGSNHAPQLVDVTLPGAPAAVLRVLSWNVYVGQHPDRVLARVRGLVREHRPDVVVLTEAYRCRRALGRVAGYRRLQGRRWPGRWLSESAEVAVLVADDVHLAGHGRLPMRRAWAHKRPKGPRVYRWVEVDKVGRRAGVLGVHLPTGGLDGRNRDAVRESLHRIGEWFA